MQTDWRNDALLLIGHGAPRFPDAGRILQMHADALRDRGCFAEVATGWLNDSPSVAEALATVRARVVHVVPFFMEHGWFVREGVPAALRDSGRVLRFHPPVGVHWDMAALAAARVERACGAAASGFSVLLVGHGSARSPGRPMALHRHAERLAATGRFARVRAAFLEEPPFIADALSEWRADPVALLGFFAGEGGHVRDDLVHALHHESRQRADAGVALLDLGIIADDPGMPDIILRQAAAELDDRAP